MTVKLNSVKPKLKSKIFKKFCKLKASTVMY